jgi:hypothetical protein
MPDDANKPELSLGELIKELQGVTDKQRQLVYKLATASQIGEQDLQSILDENE